MSMTFLALKQLALKRLAAVAAVSAVVTSATLAPLAAHACGNVYFSVVNPAIFEARHSAEFLRDGAYAAAAKAVIAAFPRLLVDRAEPWLAIPYGSGQPSDYDKARQLVGRQPFEPVTGAQDRAVRVLALAILRSNGRALPASDRRHFRSQDGIVRWAITVVTAPRAKVAGQPPPMPDHDVVWQAERAEAMALTADGAAAAQLVLEQLAKADLVGDPLAMAALARLRSQQGDRVGATQALARCGDLAPKGSMCKAYLARPALTATNGGPAPPAQLGAR